MVMDNGADKIDRDCFFEMSPGWSYIQKIDSYLVTSDQIERWIIRAISGTIGREIVPWDESVDKEERVFDKFEVPQVISAILESIIEYGDFKKRHNT